MTCMCKVSLCNDECLCQKLKWWLFLGDTFSKIWRTALSFSLSYQFWWAWPNVKVTVDSHGGCRGSETESCIFSLGSYQIDFKLCMVAIRMDMIMHKQIMCCSWIWRVLVIMQSTWCVPSVHQTVTKTVTMVFFWHHWREIFETLLETSLDNYTSIPI